MKVSEIISTTAIISAITYLSVIYSLYVNEEQIDFACGISCGGI